MAASLASLPKNYELPAVTFELSPEWVAKYAGAVGDEVTGRLGGGHVPPLGIAALAIRALLQQAALPPGTLHAAQELSFQRAVSAGESLTVSARIASRGERGGWVLMSVDLQAADSTGAPVMSGRATVTFPAGEVA